MTTTALDPQSPASSLSIDARQAASLTGPDPALLAEATLGLFALGVAAALGVPTDGLVGRVVPGVWATAIATFALTGPSFLVAHQYFDHRSPPRSIVHAVAHGYAAMGVAAGGLSPFVLLFAATSGGWLPALSAAVALAGVVGLGRVRRELMQVDPSLNGLSRGWALLAGAVALRLGADLLWAGGAS